VRSRRKAPRAASDKRSDGKPSDHEAAIEEACRHLRRLFIDVVPWSEQGASTSSAEKEFRNAIAFVKCFAHDSALDGHPLAAVVRKAAIPAIERGRAAKGRHGQYGDLNASRDRTIAKTVQWIGKQFELSQEQASSVVSEALKSLVHEHRRVFRRLIPERKADPSWIDECLQFVDKLWLSEDRVEDIAKKYRTQPFVSKTLT